MIQPTSPDLAVIFGDIPTGCRRLLVYGGSFDPPHRAHATLPPLVARKLHADAVLYIPAGTPPHKQRRLGHAEDRLTMLILAMEGVKHIAISSIEIDRPGPSYTADTLAILRGQLGPKVEMRLLIGSDMAAIFPQWRDPDRIIQLAEPVVMLRPPHDADALLNGLPADQRDIWRRRIVRVPKRPEASRDVRQLLAEGRYTDPRVVESLSPAVLGYIRARRLYRDEQPEIA